MNKYERALERDRKSAMRVSVLIGTIGLGFAMLALAALGVIFAAPQRFWWTTIVFLAVVLLVLRQVMRRLSSNGRKLARPDPESILKLD